MAVSKIEKTLTRGIDEIFQSGIISTKGSWETYSLTKTIKDGNLYSVQIQSENQIFGQIIIRGSWLKGATIQNPIMIYRGSASKTDSNNVYISGSTSGSMKIYVGASLNDFVSLAIYEFFT